MYGTKKDRDKGVVPHTSIDAEAHWTKSGWHGWCAARFVLGDLHYNAPNVQAICEQAGQILVTTQYGPDPHSGDGVEVRRVFHKLRSTAIENFNEQFKGIFDGHEQVPTRGLRNAQRFALGAILLCQLALLYRSQHSQPLRGGLRAFLKAA